MNQYDSVNHIDFLCSTFAPLELFSGERFRCWYSRTTRIAPLLLLDEGTLWFCGIHWLY